MRKRTNEEQNIFELLKGVIDPELMINIIDLGLVYDIRHKPAEEKIEVEITLTSPGCPMGDVIIEDAKQLIENHFRNFKVEILLVWEPAWNKEMLSEAGKKALGSI
ncbi:Fe-S protein maturation auxiliary factor SufT [Flavobacteriales bacterium]|nr:Fe-S protein maturation auxiliary factor SufT [Flavobacteriales bacterium]MCL4815957.1 DUF59 domain-containing protein [Flavobacteriales bacterium]WKZ74288.1 MAG: metal-sulfur cluster assembly factor [Vicingaceae bacterium]GIK70650.1 MAG: hypothetical protein BroJett020_19450 [Bacteroidota bacterium]CAG0978226.1 Fe-S protein maturation auxiliary factor SufT [Flavobacteriales bacterium]